jgi:hypothetical protein
MSVAEPELWSGPGCEGQADLEFDHVSATGVRIYRKVTKGAPGAPGGESMSAKKHNTATAVAAVDSAIETLAREAFPSDDAARAQAKFLKTADGATLYSVRCALESVRGTGVSVAKVSAEAAIQAAADRIAKRDPALTPAAAYAKALRDNPELYTRYLEE